MSDPAQADTRHHVVIVGGGFGGVRAAKRLGRSPNDVRITLIDRTNHHLFQPLLYQVATGILSPGQIAPALRGMFRKQPNVDIVLAEVLEVELDPPLVRAVADRELLIPYDSLIIAAGATHSYFGHDEWASVAPGMKSLDDANRVRSRILEAFELADQADSEVERREWLTFVVVGGGPTGVELAGQIAVLARHILTREYRHIDSRSARIILADAAPTVLGPFHPKLQARALHDLGKLGVEVHLDSMAVAIDRNGINLEKDGTHERIATRTVLWAAGVTASPLGRQVADAAGVEVDRSGRVPVSPDCSLPGHPNIFVIGDMAALPGVPGVAQPAIQEGLYVAKVITARLRGSDAPAPFHYLDKGSMATIGRTRAVAQVGNLRFGGPAAFMLWAVVHLAYLVGWGSRWEAVIRWVWTIVARNRRERLISAASLVNDHELDARRDPA